MQLSTVNLFGAFVLSMLLAACSSEDSGKAIDTNTPPENPSEASGLISGIDITAMNRDVRPQDDFWQYANGAWLASAKIPADEVGWGSYMTLRKRALEQSLAIVEDLRSAPLNGNPKAKKLTDFYQAWMNAERVEGLGLEPIADDLMAIAAIDSHARVAAYFGEKNAAGIDGPLNFYVDQDAKNSLNYVVNFTQSGLGLPDRDSYFDESERGRAIISAYKAYLERLLTLAEIENPSADVERIMQLETKLAEKQWDKVKNRNYDLTYNATTHAELEKMLSNLGFAQYLEDIGVPRQAFYNVRQPDYFVSLNGIFLTTDVASWRAYLRARTLTTFAAYLPEEFVAARFAYRQAVYGLEAQAPRWRRAITSINRQIGELLGEFYVAKHFAPSSKEKMEEMVANLIDAYADSIRDLDWMGDATREKALQKLSKFTPKIGYPDTWTDYSTLAISADDLLGNIQRARIFSHEKNVAKLGQPIDRSEWAMPPQTVNAYYRASLNEIVFPAAFLQPPNFIPTAEDAVNYGAIGSTIGHEIGHGFDDQGSKYDGDGNLKSWWTEEDRREFEARTEGLVGQFSAYEVKPGLSVNGKLTLGENIGDLGGAAIALKAYLKSLDGQEPPVIDGFTGVQRFFLGSAQASQVKWRDEFLELIVKTDPHSPSEYRINGVMPNLDAFYEAYGVKEGDRMFIAPEERVRIWR